MVKDFDNMLEVLDSIFSSFVKKKNGHTHISISNHKQTVEFVVFKGKNRGKK
jgi:hypothetical protein